MSNPNEESFESAVSYWLVEHGGYDLAKNDKDQGSGSDFDRVTGIDRSELASFIKSTQHEAWDELVHRYDDDIAQATVKFHQRVAKEVASRGVVDVLRHGVTDLGVKLRLAYFKPAHGLSEELLAKYRANRLTVTRQLRYEVASNNSLDLTLFVNGLLVATAELKNTLTGQGVEEAMTQYRVDRNPKNVVLSNAVVHFAVDPQRVAMTTQLAGEETRFLPFNQGHNLGPGNPPNPHGHATSYLWERVWEREAWLDLLGRFVHVEKTGRGSRKSATVIFPRFHQWDAVRQVEMAARKEGPGNHYLIQHSAGSGKSNTIAWLAHRLSTLHKGDEKVFDKVIVITDRLVLDRQLQDTIYQFEHTHGVVERIEQDSQQLADAVAGEQARIIITTIQKFPFVLDKIEKLPARDYAVVIDEAHSSQSGDTATELRRVLGAKDVQGDVGIDEVVSALAQNVAARGRQPNMSSFAFTATPKGKTLELFGRKSPSTGKYEPFHLYSMRQAIGEGFVLDILANYVTYETYFHLEKALEEDPRYQTAKARKSIAQFVTFHEHNLSQKARVVADHFLAHVHTKIAGKAKAMVVCGSREHAVRFYQALQKYITEQGADLGVLVAFSGDVQLNGHPKLTEASANGFPDSQTADKFDSDAYRIMVVAEKFQTGFDQPKLYAMYVDKTLTGLAAVQTLSRLNRIYPDKTGTFILDFVNDANAIAAEFEEYYGKTVAPPTDPNLLYDTRHALDDFGVLDPQEALTFARLLLAQQVDHSRLHGALAPAIDRFGYLDEDEQERFRDCLDRFVRIYSFLSQIVTFGDIDLERDYLFGKALLPFVRRDPGDAVDLSGAVELTHLRIEKQFEGSVELASEVGEAITIYSGTGRRTEEEPERLSEIIEQINVAHGTEWTDGDRLIFDAVLYDLVSNPEFQTMAAHNSAENFAEVFPHQFQQSLISRSDRNEKVVFRFLDDPELQKELFRVYGPYAQTAARVAYQEQSPIAELLNRDENAYLEYKSTLRTSAGTGEVVKPLETACIKTVAAFLNSSFGGTLLIGVADDGSVHGLASDYVSLHKEGKTDRDRFELHWSQLLINSVGEAAASNVTQYFHTVGGSDLCRVHVRPSAFPVDANIKIEKNGQTVKVSAFYVRISNGTRQITNEVEKQKYIGARWGS